MMSGSLKARQQAIWFPTRKHVGLNSAGTGGFNVLGSMGTLLALRRTARLRANGPDRCGGVCSPSAEMDVQSVAFERDYPTAQRRSS